MTEVAVIGCGVVGATIAYELSRVPGLKVTVLDRQLPAKAATGAALGVLMGVISQKTKGRAWRLRQVSIQRYATLIPELEATTGLSLPCNRHGIVSLLVEEAARSRWQQLAEVRRVQGWPLELWSLEQLQQRCPLVQNARVVGAVYSPADRQIDPTQLTLALVEAAQQNGVRFRFDAEVKQLQERWPQTEIQLVDDRLLVDWVVVAAGLGSAEFTQGTAAPLTMQPVLGQALHLKLPQPLGHLDFQPVITGEDIHIVPLSNGEYWVGATVEFPAADGQAVAEAERLNEVWQGAIAFCPDLAAATLLKTWSGLRPRPANQTAPVVEPLVGYRQVILATGHYRNGVLLAPATAELVRSLITG